MSYLSLSRRWLQVLAVVLPLVAFAPHSRAQEKPYFVTYSHDLEEPGNLDVETKTALAQPGGSNRYGATALELEYGVRAWWTSELYLDGQATSQDSTIFTGFRIENRVRPLMRDHVINPVLYVEYENTSGADKTLLEVVGHDGQSDLAEPNGDARHEHQHEAELKLILSSNIRDWNVSENFISEKNLGHEPWEFGYAFGASRPLRLLASPHPCAFCAENFMAGIEMYGGLGDRHASGLHDTSQYIGPTLNWATSYGTTFTISTQFGLNDYSIPRLYRFGISYEIPQFFSRFHKDGAR